MAALNQTDTYDVNTMSAEDLLHAVTNWETNSISSAQTSTEDMWDTLVTTSIKSTPVILKTNSNLDPSLELQSSHQYAVQNATGALTSNNDGRT